jgi:hypothetical protein
MAGFYDEAGGKYDPFCLVDWYVDLPVKFLLGWLACRLDAVSCSVG